MLQFKASALIMLQFNQSDTMSRIRGDNLQLVEAKEDLVLGTKYLPAKAGRVEGIDLC